MGNKRTSNACISFVFFCAVNVFLRFMTVNGMNLFVGDDKGSFRWCQGRMNEIPFSLRGLEISSKLDVFFKHKNKAGVFLNVCHLELNRSTCVSSTPPWRCESVGDFRYKLLKNITSDDAGVWLMEMFQLPGDRIKINIDVIACPDETTITLTTQNGEDETTTTNPRQTPDDKNTVSTLSMFTRQTETAGNGLHPQFIALIVVSCSSFIMAVMLITLLYRRCVGRRRNKPTMTLESDEEGYRTYEEIRETALPAEKRRVKDDRSYEHPMRKSEETDRTYEPLTPSQDPDACSKRLKTAPSHPDMRTEHDRPLAGAHPGKSDCSPLSHQVFTGAYFLPKQEESPYLIPVTEDKVTCQLSAPHFHENQTRRSVLESPYLTTVWDAKMQLCAENPYLTPVVDRKQTSYHFAHT